MLEDDEYPSDSDQSDEDYNPDGNNSEAGSEVESDGEVESGDEVVAKQPKSTKQRKRKTKSQGPSGRKSRRLDGSSEVHNKLADEEQEERVAQDGNDEDAEKKRADALWADFLSDTDPPKSAKKEHMQEEVKTNGSTKSTNNSTLIAKEVKEEIKVPEKRTITEIFDFAGEKVEVQKVVEVGSSSAAAADNRPFGRKSGVQGRSVRTGGIGSLLNQLGNAKKISVLEKTKLDWSGFKQKEGIEEDLQTHNKGKDGYLERQDFLERTDFRQFELEKNQRMTSRRK